MGSKASHTWEAFCISWRINVGEKEQEQAKVVVITGGTSGVGLAAARRFLAGGASVCIAGRDPVRGAAAVRELLKAVPGSMAHVYFRAADVRDIAACQALMQAAAERYGRLDVLVNSAGVYLEGALGTLTEQQFDDVIDVNLKGTVFACQAALPYLRQTKGCIVNVGSDAGVHGNYNCTAYCAANFACRISIRIFNRSQFHRRRLTVNDCRNNAEIAYRNGYSTAGFIIVPRI